MDIMLEIILERSIVMCGVLVFLYHVFGLADFEYTSNRFEDESFETKSLWNWR